LIGNKPVQRIHRLKPKLPNFLGTRTDFSPQ
jgi:hypothetical protein